MVAVQVLKEYAQQNDIIKFYQLLDNIQQSELTYNMFAEKKFTTKELVDLVLVFLEHSAQIQNNILIVMRVTEHVKLLQEYAQKGNFKAFIKESGAGLSYYDEVIKKLSNT